MVGVAVKVMLAPAQIVVDGVAIVTAGTNTGLTVTTTGVEATAVVEVHSALLTISTVIEFGEPIAVPVVFSVEPVCPAITTVLFFQT